MRILVTGGSGYLGRSLVNLFGADDLSRRTGHDILNIQDAAIVADYDVVIHLAAHLDKSPENAEETFLVNVEGTVNLLRAMQPNSVFIFASTKDVYGKNADNFGEVPEHCLIDYHGQSPLEWSKFVAEKYVEFYAELRNFRSCIFRMSTIVAPASPANLYGFVNHYVETIANGGRLELPGDGAPRRDLLFVDDLYEACKKFIDSDITRGIYNLGGGQDNSITLSELANKISLNSDWENAPEIVRIPARPTPFNYVSDISKIEHELGWRPGISVDSIIQRLIDGQA